VLEHDLVDTLAGRVSGTFRSHGGQPAAQAPGPRGSPHVPQPAVTGAGVAPSSRERARAVTDSTRVSSVAPQDGQDGTSSRRTSCSKSDAHVRQVYSYRGAQQICPIVAWRSTGGVAPKSQAQPNAESRRLCIASNHDTSALRGTTS